MHAVMPLLAAIVTAIVPVTTSFAEDATVSTLDQPRPVATAMVSAEPATATPLDAQPAKGASPMQTLEVAAAGDVVAPDATGQYQYLCLLASGYEYFLPAGEPMTNCQGTYLTKYLDGNRLQTYSLTPATTTPWDGSQTGCIVAVAGLAAGVAVLILNPPTGALLWVLNAGATTSSAYGVATCLT